MPNSPIPLLVHSNHECDNMETKIASGIVNLVRVPGLVGKRIIFYTEGGYHVESFMHGPGWCLDNDGLTDEQCRDVLATVGSKALGIAAMVDV